MKLIILLFTLILLINSTGCTKEEKMNEETYTTLREQMVQTQISERGIKDKRVLQAMRKVPRHEFMPQDVRYLAYEDRAVSIGYDQTISQPYIVALMTEAVRVKPKDRVLEIGTGSGYQAAVLSLLAKEIYTIEIIPELAKRAEKDLKRLGYKNVHIKTGDGFLGIPEKAPFNAIIVTCAPPEIPPPLINQLAEGGRLVIPVGDTYPQQLILAEKKKGQIHTSYITAVLFVPMTGENVQKLRNKK